MYRVFCLVAWTAFFMISFSSGAFALRNETRPNNPPSSIASALILKFAPEVEVPEGASKSGIVFTDNPELNRFDEGRGGKRHIRSYPEGRCQATIRHHYRRGRVFDKLQNQGRRSTMGGLLSMTGG